MQNMAVGHCTAAQVTPSSNDRANSFSCWPAPGSPAHASQIAPSGAWLKKVVIPTQGTADCCQVWPPSLVRRSNEEVAGELLGTGGTTMSIDEAVVRSIAAAPGT